MKEEDVLAHELGHFVTDVFRTLKTGHGGNSEFTTDEQLEEERKAWRLAEMTKPDVDRRVEKNVLGHYEEVVRTFPGMPVRLLKYLGLLT